MSSSTAATARPVNIIGALCGPLYVILFFISDTIARPLAKAQPVLPDGPPADMLRYYIESGTAIMVHSAFHVVSAVLLIVFVLTIGRVLAQSAPESGSLRQVTVIGGVLSGVLLIISAVISVIATLASGGLDESGAQALRLTNFYTGGTIHVALLGVFAGGAGLIALKSRPWARGFSWFGIVSGAFSILSLLSLAFYYATPLIPLGRFSHFAWAILIAVVLLIKRQRQ